MKSTRLIPLMLPPIALFLGAISCGHPESKNEPQPRPVLTPPANRSVTDPNLVFGIRPEEYFTRFFYKRSLQPNTYQYLRLEGHPLIQLRTGLVSYNVDLLLFPTGTYLLAYTESHPSAEGASDSGSEVFHKTVLAGNWRIDGAKMNLGAQAALSGVEHEGQQTVQILFHSDLHTPGIQGTSAVLAYSQSSKSSEDQRVDLLDSGNSFSWLMGNWEERSSDDDDSQASRPNRLKIEAGDFGRTFVREVLEPVRVLHNGRTTMAVCRYRSSSSYFSVEGVVERKSLAYRLLSMVDRVEIVLDPKNDAELCDQFIEQQKKRIEQDGLFEHHGIRRGEEGALILNNSRVFKRN